jgi:esterase/lipase superfamily enzyme
MIGKFWFFETMGCLTGHVVAGTASFCERIRAVCIRAIQARSFLTTHYDNNHHQCIHESPPEDLLDST